MTVELKSEQVEITPASVLHETLDYYVHGRRSTRGGEKTLHLPDPNSDRENPKPRCSATLRRTGSVWAATDTSCYPLGFFPICKFCRALVDFGHQTPDPGYEAVYNEPDAETVPDSEVPVDQTENIELEPEPESVGPHPALGYTRVYDSLHRTYRSGPNLDPIVSPSGADPDVEYVDPPMYSGRPWDSANYPCPREFAGYYGVHVEMLPFEHREYDVLDVFAHVQEFLAERPVTCERVTQQTLSGPGQLGTGNQPLPLDTACLLAGWWPGEPKPSSGTQFMHPGYCHPHERSDCITDPVARVSMLERAAAVYLDFGDLATMWGVAPRTAFEFAVDRRGIQWGVHRDRGRTKMARTAKTIHEWGHQWSDIAAALGRPVSTVKTWAAEWASEFNPPPDPNVGGYERGIRDWASQRRDRRQVVTRQGVLQSDEW